LQNRASEQGQITIVNRSLDRLVIQNSTVPTTTWFTLFPIGM